MHRNLTTPIQHIMNKIITPPHNKSSRSAGLDLIRSIAILFVISSHFFINTPAQSAIFDGYSMFLQGIGRTLFMINVPLFLILTGYLNINKKISREYYKGIIAVLLSYLFISIVTIVCREFLLGEHLSVVRWILKITDFSAINYAWYIEMWIGLFLLTPFLNILWKNIETKRDKRILIATLYILCALPDMFNRYGVRLVPGYWDVIYPCAFYFIGSYIREYQPVKKNWMLGIFILGCCLINPVFNALFVRNHSMIQLVGDGNGMIGMPLAAAVFLLLYKIDIKNVLIRRILESISKVSLDMYLISYIFDLIYYQWFKEHFFVTQSQFGVWFFVIVPLVFISSYIFSLVKKSLFIAVHLPTK